jgi:predicted transposase
VKQTLVVKLAPTPDQNAALLRTLHTFNTAGDDIAGAAFAQRRANKVGLQQLDYYDIRERFGLAAQMTNRAIAKVAEAYKRDRNIQPRFRPHSAMAYDERMLSFPRVDRGALLALEGRAEPPVRFGAYQQARLDRIGGQADLLYRNGTFYLACTVDAPEPRPDRTSEYLGVDLGIVNIATTSDRESLNQTTGPKHAHVNTVRAPSARLRDKAQVAGVRVALVNPAYTSQTCSSSGQCEKANRISQARFRCVTCGYSAHADLRVA